MEVFGITLLGTQLGWLFPGTLAVLLSIILPIVIHLLSKNRGKLIQVGSVRLIPVKKIKRVNEIRLVERLLLLVRIMMLCALSLLLASPYFKTLSNIKKASHHILVTQDWLAFSDVAERQQVVERLDNEDASLYVIDPNGAQAINAESFLAFEISEQPQIMNIWQEVASFHSDLNADSQLSVYTTDRINQFVGQNSNINREVEWNIKAVPPSITPAEVGDGINVLVLTDENRNTSYLETGLQVLKQLLTGLNTNIEFVGSNNIDAAEADVIFYLSRQALDSSVLDRVKAGAVLIFDAASQSQIVEASVSSYLSVDSLVTPKLHNGFNLYLVGEPHVVGGENSNITPNQKVLWKAEEGLALLVSQRLGKGKVLSFYSRFDPEWNDWVLSPSFPHDLAELVIPKKLKLKTEDNLLTNGRLSEGQIIRTGSSGDRTDAKSEGSKFSITEYDTPLWQYLAVILILLFCLERLFSEFSVRKKTEHLADVSEGKS
ncbi:hypothetical protein EYS14_03735 [Alteromonadaceae bacterium M269]|nr:hypothetical protein EYS14_03735 [Alteromonadaceae bacterium M269]